MLKTIIPLSTESRFEDMPCQLLIKNNSSDFVNEKVTGVDWDSRAGNFIDDNCWVVCSGVSPRNTTSHLADTTTFFTKDFKFYGRG